MKRILLISLALFLSTAASTFADDAPATASDKRLSLTVGGMYGFSLNGTSLRAAHAPGLTAVFGYEITPRSSMLVSWAHQNYQIGNNHATDDILSLSYRYWLTDSRTWRPWVQIGAGYAWERYEEEWLGAHYRYGSGDFQFNFGGGLRYKLSDNFGLDASALLYKGGAPWKWSYRTKLITTSLGADVLF